MKLSKSEIAAGESLYNKIGFGATRDAETLAAALKASVAEERARCVAICELWLLQYGNRGDELEHTSAQEWANGAVQDIAEHIRKGA